MFLIVFSPDLIAKIERKEFEAELRQKADEEEHHLPPE